MQVMYLGRAPRTKESLPDFHEKCRINRHPLVFRGLTGSQRTPGNGATQSAQPDRQLSSVPSPDGRDSGTLVN